MKGVILFKGGQNINRVYRLCYIYGIKDLYLVQCKPPQIGNVFSAKGKVAVHILDEMPRFENMSMKRLNVCGIRHLAKYVQKRISMTGI